ncbi:hypothetical protein HG531_011406 [Fusarium graminearum]|nr:hypothetical protein HG531_011406 [Fusarium graminearum]
MTNFNFGELELVKLETLDANVNLEHMSTILATCSLALVIRSGCDDEFSTDELYTSCVLCRHFDLAYNLSRLRVDPNHASLSVDGMPNEAVHIYTETVRLT